MQTHEDKQVCDMSHTEERPTDAEQKVDAGHGIVTARAGSTAGVERQDHLSLVPGLHASERKAVI